MKSKTPSLKGRSKRFTWKKFRFSGQIALDVAPQRALNHVYADHFRAEPGEILREARPSAPRVQHQFTREAARRVCCENSRSVSSRTKVSPCATVKSHEGVDHRNSKAPTYPSAGENVGR